MRAPKKDEDDDELRPGYVYVITNPPRMCVLISTRACTCTVIYLSTPPIDEDLIGSSVTVAAGLLRSLR